MWPRRWFRMKKCHEYVLLGIIWRAKCEYCTCNCDYLHHSIIIIIIIIILSVKASFLHVLYRSLSLCSSQSLELNNMFISIRKLIINYPVVHSCKCHLNLFPVAYPIILHSTRINIRKRRGERELPITAPRKTEISLLIRFYSLQLIVSIVHRKQANHDSCLYEFQDHHNILFHKQCHTWIYDYSRCNLDSICFLWLRDRKSYKVTHMEKMTIMNM